MDSMSALMRGEQARKSGSKGKVFDWNKAAQIIKKRKPIIASAGLSGDWEWTGGTIYQDGKPKEQGEFSLMYLASIWATPELDIDGKIIDCYIGQDNNPNNWNADTFWPQSALDILNGKVK